MQEGYQHSTTVCLSTMGGMVPDLRELSVWRGKQTGKQISVMSELSQRREQMTAWIESLPGRDASWAGP